MVNGTFRKPPMSISDFNDTVYYTIDYVGSLVFYQFYIKYICMLNIWILEENLIGVPLINTADTINHLVVTPT